MESGPALTVRDVAVLLNVNEKTVYRLASRGELPGFKVAGIWRFKKDDLDEWVERQKLASSQKRNQREDGDGSIEARRR